MSVELRCDKSIPLHSWLALFRAGDYNHWWSERNARAALGYAYLVVTAWDAEQAVGTLTVWSDGVNFAWIDDVVVHPDHRGLGIGSRLVREALARIHEAGIEHVQLFPIPGRESFFARFGFVEQDGAKVMDLQRGEAGDRQSSGGGSSSLVAASPELTIRRATADDVPDVRRLQEQWAKDAETIAFQPAPENLLAGFVGGCFFVAEISGQTVGFAYALAKHNAGQVSAVVPDGQRYLEIEDLYVLPQNRSGGIGSQLVDAMRAWAQEQGIRRLIAYSSTRQLDRVLRFYRSCGFEGWAVQLVCDLGPSA